MIIKIKKYLSNLKYIFRTNLYLSKINIFNILILGILILFLSFTSIYLAIPFLEVLTHVENDNEVAKYFNSLLNFFGLEKSFFVCSTMFVLSIFLKSFFELIYDIYLTKIQFQYIKNEGMQLNKKVINMYQSFFLKYSSSKLLNLYTRELERGSDLIKALFISINSLLQLLIFLIIPLYFNFTLTISFLFLLIIFLSPLLFLNYLSMKSGMESTIVGDKFTKSLTNNISHFKFISIHGLLNTANNLFKNSFNIFAKNKIKLNLWGGIIRNNIQPICILCIVATFSLTYKSIEDIPVLGAILWSLTRILSPIGIILSSFNLINQQVGAFKNIYQAKHNFDEMQIKNGPREIDSINKISLKNLTLKYEDKIILEDITFELKKREKIVIIGKTGSGKSTLMDVISNVVQIDSGLRKINDIDYENINFKNLRNKISYTPQMLSIIDANTREYFEFYNEKIDEKKINYFLDLFNCREFLKNKDSNLNVYLGDKGIKLSGGQKQKIILAAALSRNPELLILDESTNAIDPSEEKNILMKLSKMDISIIFISHKFQLQEIFDKVYKIEKGKLLII